jgi:hypothetical protein
MAHRKWNRPAKMTSEEAQLAARMIREYIAEEGISQTDAIGVFVYAVAQTLHAMLMKPNEHDPTLYTITRALEGAAYREGAVLSRAAASICPLGRVPVTRSLNRAAHIRHAPDRSIAIVGEQ